MVIEWLREMARLARANPILALSWSDERGIATFIDWLERTGATPCDDCECKAAYVLQELRRGNFTEVPLPKEKP